MRDCAELVKDARYCYISGDCAFCNRKGSAENWRLCQDGLLKDTADAIEELLAELERYRHAAFVIGETCVEESKGHITANEAVKKIRENIYYSRQMPLPEPPKEDAK